MSAALLLSLLASAATPAHSPDLVSSCLAALRREPKALSPYECLFNAGLNGQARDVRSLFERMVRLHPEDPRPALFLALFREFAGESVPLSDYRQAVAAFRREQEPLGLAYALTLLVANQCFGHRQCDASAEAALAEAEGLAEASSNNHLRRLVQLQWLRVAFHDDDRAKAERAEARLEATPDNEDPDWLKQGAFELRARLDFELNNLEREYDISSEMLNESAPGTMLHAIALGGLGEAAAHLAIRDRANRSEAEALLRRALKEQDGLKLSYTIIGNGTLRTTENLALLLGPTEESIGLLEHDLAVYEEERGWLGLDLAFRTEWMLAQYLVDSRPTVWTRALALADRTIDRASKKQFLWEHAHGLLVRGYLLWKTGRREDAKADVASSLRELETLRSKQEDFDVRIRYEDTLAYVYELVAGLTLDPRFGKISAEDVESAFSITERMRARALLEDLLARNRAKAPWQGQEAFLQNRIRTSHEVLMDAHSPVAVRPTAVAELRRSEEQLVSLRVTEAGAARNAPHFPSLKQVQEALAPREALVSFQVWSPDAMREAPFVDGRSWATVVTRSAVRVVPIPNANQLETRVKFFQQLLKHRDDSDGAGSALLYNALMDPVVRSLEPEVEDLVLIPDGPLNRLPFDALRMSPSGKFLAQRFRLTLVPSAAIWLSLRTRPRAPAGLALVLAQSEYDGVTTLDRSAFGQPLADLANAKAEGLRAVRSFPAGSVLISGASASKSALLRMDLHRFALLHFATHSLIDPLAPENSAIVLASAGADNGLLRVEDISKLSLEGKTVVLASCSTLAGVLRRTEGLMSLSRPFLGAGAQAVVGTLEAVRDAESSEFFDEFYSALSQGNSVGDALASAKRARIRQGAPPAAWAAFVLLGNGAAAPRASDSSRGVVVAGLVCGVLALAAVVLRLRSRWTRFRRPRADRG